MYDFDFDRIVSNYSVGIQDYTLQPGIEGVCVQNIDRYNDETGNFTELLRMNKCSIDLAQVNYSELSSFAVKAFHIHKTQTDIIFVPPSSKVLLILIDLRNREGHTQRGVLGDCKSQLVTVPPGVAHGFKNLLDCPASLIYFVDRYFTDNEEECEEYRMPADYFGDDIWYEMTE